MTVDRYLRMIAGAFVMLTLALGYWVSPYWLLFTGFVGSTYSNQRFLRKSGVRDTNPPDLLGSTGDRNQRAA